MRVEGGVTRQIIPGDFLEPFVDERGERRCHDLVALAHRIDGAFPVAEGVVLLGEGPIFEASCGSSAVDGREAPLFDDEAQ